MTLSWNTEIAQPMPSEGCDLSKLSSAMSYPLSHKHNVHVRDSAIKISQQPLKLYHRRLLWPTGKRPLYLFQFIIFVIHTQQFLISTQLLSGMEWSDIKKTDARALWSHCSGSRYRAQSLKRLFYQCRWGKKTQRSHIHDCEQCAPLWSDLLNSSILDFNAGYNNSFTSSGSRHCEWMCVCFHACGCLVSNLCVGSIRTKTSG